MNINLSRSAIHSALFLSFLLGISPSADAKPTEAERVRLAVEKKSGSDLPKPIKASKSPVPGIWEIQLADGNIVYANTKATHLFVGALIDLDSKKNITQERISDLSKITWEQLPLEHSIARVNGDGSLKVALFSDPNCNFCKKQEEVLLKLENSTVYTFLIPLLGGSSARVADAIWCSDNRAAALNSWWTDGLPKTTEPCKTPTAENMALASRLGVSSTPTFVFPSMRRADGYQELAPLKKMLSANQMPDAKDKNRP